MNDTTKDENEEVGKRQIFASIQYIQLHPHTYIYILIYMHYLPSTYALWNLEDPKIVYYVRA